MFPRGLRPRDTRWGRGSRRRCAPFYIQAEVEGTGLLSLAPRSDEVGLGKNKKKGGLRVRDLNPHP